MALTDRAIWITGAGKGIGRALALALAQDGNRVAVSARTRDDLDSLVSEAETASGHIVAFPLDITEAPVVPEIIKAIEAEIGPLDMAILNAGTHQAMWLDDLETDAVRRLMDVNFMGTVNCLVPLVHRFRERRTGQIAVVASVAGYRGLPSAGAYSASKAGLIAFCEALKPELDVAGVKLTLINPGFVDTPLTRKNDFDMPFLISQDEAVGHILSGLRRSGFDIAFPLPMALVMRCLRILPDRLFFSISRRMVRK